MHRLDVHFAGRVQGVGFRYTTRRLASRYRVTGFVQNLADGRVKLVVEGSEEDIRDLLQEIQSAMSGHIRETQVNKSSASGEFEDFEIRF